MFILKSIIVIIITVVFIFLWGLIVVFSGISDKIILYSILLVIAIIYAVIVNITINM